jgi:hypothetical protein
VEAAGPDAGRRGALACRPGPQASSLHSARPVKSAPPGAVAGLTPGPEPRAGASRSPPRQEGAALGQGRPPGGYRTRGTVARTATVRATVVHAPAAGRRPGAGSPGCARRVMLTEGSVIGRSLAPPGFPSTTEIGFSGPFLARPQEVGTGEAGKRGCCRRSGYLRRPFRVPVKHLGGVAPLRCFAWERGACSVSGWLSCPCTRPPSGRVRARSAARGALCWLKYLSRAGCSRLPPVFLLTLEIRF